MVTMTDLMTEYQARWGRLTKREQQIAQLFAAGQSTQEIADHLGIARQTVKNHLISVYHTLGLKPHAGRGRRLTAMLKYYDGYFAGMHDAERLNGNGRSK